MPATTILSPHIDDAVLSLWAVLAGPGEVTVMNVFDGVPEGRGALGVWDQLTRAEDPVARAEERRAEDEAAMRLLGRSAVNLGFIDAQYANGEPTLERLVECIARALPPHCRCSRRLRSAFTPTTRERAPPRWHCASEGSRCRCTRTSHTPRPAAGPPR